ncbi:SRPBCC domain-containing protein [Sphingomonas bacterium]|uniref:SRPBCC domain-containing protein n=1 Tax=Sphingomonas bacterium TaxID=1895847 RepID=UPI00157600A3|nr:SRPBCC domain-containing protein [Sphingomonas bacterium]
MKPVLTSIEIAAPPERVWRILTDFSAYPEWNPFVQSISGTVKPGEKLSVSIRPPGGRTMAFKPTVLVARNNQELRWRGRLILPGLFDGEHFFQLSPAKDGTLLKHGENFSGLIVRMMGSSTFEQTGRGFAAMNEALKKRAEA